MNEGERRGVSPPVLHPCAVLQFSYLYRALAKTFCIDRIGEPAG